MTHFFMTILAHSTFALGVVMQYTAARTRNRRHYQAAERHYSAVLVVLPNHQRAKRARGLLRWRELNDPDGAIADFQDLRLSDPDYHIAYFYEGMALVELGEYREAVFCFSEFLVAAPESRYARSATLQLQSLSHIVDALPPLLSASDKASSVDVDD